MKASFPHCDSDVLHAPGTCVFCDHYPEKQNFRAAAGINFTGQHEAGKLPCPSEQRRPLDTINRWPGNRQEPYTAEDESTLDDYIRDCTREPEHDGPCNGLPRDTCNVFVDADALFGHGAFTLVFDQQRGIVRNLDDELIEADKEFRIALLRRSTRDLERDDKEIDYIDESTYEAIRPSRGTRLFNKLRRLF